MTHRLCISSKPPYCVEMNDEQDIRSVLDLTSFRVRSGCRGIGACAMCKIQILEGEANEPSQEERLHLREDELQSGIRLACQTKCHSDMSIKIINPANKSIWRSLAVDFCTKENCDIGNGSGFKDGYGVAVDLGTTNISIALFSYCSNEVLTVRIGPNPQSKFGLDFISRIDAAVESYEDAKSLEALAIEAIGSGLMDISVREGIALERIKKLLIVGNTAMLSLLCNSHQTKVIDPSQWEKQIKIDSYASEKWIDLWGIAPDASVEVISPIAGFIGSDIKAGIVATNLKEHASSLLIDFGTNSEMVLAVDGHVWSTSGSGGPAFEGVGIDYGMSAMEGAIYQADYTPKSNTWSFDIIDSDNASGICGSGLISIIALLLKHEFLKESGNFRDGEYKWKLPIEQKLITISKSDIDKIQQAKAAIATGIAVLCDKAKIDPAHIGQLFIAGAFGRYLDIEKAKEIGMLPPIESSRIHKVGNSALNGAVKALCNDEAYLELTQTDNACQTINLSNIPEFGTLFFTNLYLAPIGSMH